MTDTFTPVRKSLPAPAVDEAGNLIVGGDGIPIDVNGRPINPQVHGIAFQIHLQHSNMVLQGLIERMLNTMFPLMEKNVGILGRLVRETRIGALFTLGIIIVSGISTYISHRDADATHADTIALIQQMHADNMLILREIAKQDADMKALSDRIQTLERAPRARK